jgi:hypothetical protein
MSEDLDLNLILHKLNKYQTKLQNGSGNLDLYRQKIQFYYEQLGGGPCNKTYWTDKKKNLLFTEIDTYFRNLNLTENLTQNLKTEILKHLKQLKDYTKMCSFLEEIKNIKNPNFDFQDLLARILFEESESCKKIAWLTGSTDLNRNIYAIDNINIVNRLMSFSNNNSKCKYLEFYKLVNSIIDENIKKTQLTKMGQYIGILL